MKKIILFFILTLVATLSAMGGSTFYSKVTTSVASGKGKVYAATMNSGEESTSSEATYSSAGISIRGEYATHSYYVVAKPEKGYAFTKWNNNNSATANPSYVLFGVNSKDKNKPDTQTYSATFEKSCLSVVSNNFRWGYATVSKPVNNIGDEVKLTAILAKTPGENENNFTYVTHPSHALSFVGWYDENDQLISTENPLTYTVKGDEQITAKFAREFTVKADENGKIHGYVRMQTPYYDENTNYFLCLTGDEPVSISADKRKLYGVVDFNQQPYHMGNANDSHAYAQSPAVFSNCGSIFYVTADAVTDKLQAVKGRTIVATNVKAYAQGTSTYDVTKNQSLSLMTADTPGFYILATSNGTYSMQMDTPVRLWVTTDKPGYFVYRDSGDLDIQPIDREHIDTNYFGAYPDENMYFDGGYWTTMYTSFPYECYEEDGVEAYVVKSFKTLAGTNYAVMEQLGSIVPAETPVILKCKGTHLKQNRLIPLEPDDQNIAEAKKATEGNLLVGEYGLWHKAATVDESGAVNYNSRAKVASNMRIFGIDSEGGIGFYQQNQAARAETAELEPNRVYLDVDKFANSHPQSESYIVSTENILTGVEDLIEDKSNETLSPEQDEVIYDLNGRRVGHMERGRIYIVNGKKVIAF